MDKTLTKLADINAWRKKNGKKQISKDTWNKATAAKKKTWYVTLYKNIGAPDKTAGAFFVYGGGLSTQFNTVSVDMDVLSSGVCLNAKALPVANDVFISAVQPDSPDAADVDEMEDSDFFANPYEDISSHAYLATEDGVKHYVVHKAPFKIASNPDTYVQVVSCVSAADGSLSSYDGLGVYSFDRYVEAGEFNNKIVLPITDTVRSISIDIPNDFIQKADEEDVKYWGVWYRNGKFYSETGDLNPIYFKYVPISSMGGLSVGCVKNCNFYSNRYRDLLIINNDNNWLSVKVCNNVQVDPATLNVTFADSFSIYVGAGWGIVNQPHAVHKNLFDGVNDSNDFTFVACKV